MPSRNPLTTSLVQFAVTCLIWTGPAAFDSAAAAPPNIILCMGDDHGWDETGYNNHPHLKTPVLDEMAATGLRLDRMYAAHPSCSPTRGSFMTGRHPNRYGTFTPNWSIRPEEITIASLLSKAGYHSMHLGKWHLGPVKEDSPTSPGAMGFNEWLSHDNFFELNPYLSHNGADPIQFRGESSEILVEQATGFIESASQKNKPFFVVIWFGSPHEPYSGLDKDLELYRDLPQLYKDKSTKVTSNETGMQVTRPLGEVLQERYAEITAMDRSLGTLRQWLGEKNLRHETLLFYCGDNGTSADGIVTSPLKGRKGTMYDGGLRVPGVIEWPAKIKSPTVSDVPVVTSDLLPTICELTGQPLPTRPLDGISLVPLLEGNMDARPQPIYFWDFNIADERSNPPYIDPALQEGTTPLVKKMNGKQTRSFVNYHHPKIRDKDSKGTRVVLDNQYKLIVDAKKSGSKELFDIRADPSEMKNLADVSPDVVSRMEESLKFWQDSVLKSLTGDDYR